MIWPDLEHPGRNSSVCGSSHGRYHCERLSGHAGPHGRQLGWANGPAKSWEIWEADGPPAPAWPQGWPTAIEIHRTTAFLDTVDQIKEAGALVAMTGLTLTLGEIVTLAHYFSVDRPMLLGVVRTLASAARFPHEF